MLLRITVSAGYPCPPTQSTHPCTCWHTHSRLHAFPPCQVVSWAQQQFLQEVLRDKPDSSINLAKVCMLLALEEEAAGQLESEPSTSVR